MKQTLPKTAVMEARCFLTALQEPRQQLQRHQSWVSYAESSPALLGLQQNEPRIEGGRGLILLCFFKNENILGFVSRSTDGKSCKPLKMLMGKGTAAEAASQDSTVFCRNGVCARASKFWGPDLAVNSCASLPCPPGPCHQTGKVCLYQFFRIPRAPSAESASHYPPAPEQSTGTNPSTEQLVIPAVGYFVKWDKAKEDTSFRETAFQNKN